MLNESTTYTTLPVADLERARRFYRDTLEMHEEMVTEGGVIYGSGGTRFFVYPSRYKASGHTQMSWSVADIKAEVAALRSKGVSFEQFDIPGVETVDGISHSGPNVWTAWFKDPDGNLLGLSQIG